MILLWMKQHFDLYPVKRRHFLPCSPAFLWDQTQENSLCGGKAPICENYQHSFVLACDVSQLHQYYSFPGNKGTDSILIFFCESVVFPWRNKAFNVKCQLVLPVMIPSAICGWKGWGRGARNLRLSL